jgi:hypothetical protein
VRFHCILNFRLYLLNWMQLLIKHVLCISDPMSPNPAGLDIGDSPLASPRATPPTVLPDDSSNSSKVGGKTTSQLGSKPLTNRRRTYQRPVSPEPLPAPYEVS